MVITESEVQAGQELSSHAIREQLEILVNDPAFRSSKRSVQFLRYVVDQTLRGAADQIKERNIGVEVFGRDPTYDTNLDHVVRTAAIELRKRLAIYYGKEEHRSELRMSLVPGSYIPRFSVPTAEPEHAVEAAAPPFTSALNEPLAGPVAAMEARPKKRFGPGWGVLVALVAIALVWLCYRWLRPVSAEDVFWKPVLDTPGEVLLAVGDVPSGPPTPLEQTGQEGTPVPVIHRNSSGTVPFADTVTVARVWGILARRGKKVTIRPEGASSFSDLRERPVVLVGAFNNEWSLRLTKQLRYTLALDPDRHLIYIRDTKHPESRSWSWETNQPTDHQGEAGRPPLQDFALISRIWNSETGHVVVSIGGLYTYGTEAAGEFLEDPQLMDAVAKAAPHADAHTNLQIVLGTTVTDGTAGPPRILAVSSGDLNR